MLDRLIAPIAVPLVGGLTAVVLALSAALWVQTHRLSAAKQEAKQRAAQALQAAIAARDDALAQRATIAAKSADLQARLTAQSLTLEALNAEKKSALDKLASASRPCLSARVVRELNRVPDAAADAAGAGSAQAAAAADPAATAAAAPAASAGDAAAGELETAQWIADAQAQYESCARVVSGWQQFWQGLPDVLR